MDQRRELVLRSESLYARQMLTKPTVKWREFDVLKMKNINDVELVMILALSLSKDT